MVRGADNPKKWTGTGNYADIGGTPQKAGAMMIVNNRLILGNLATDGPVAVDVSANLDFDTGWAQVKLLADTPGHIKTMLEGGPSQGYIYKSDGIHAAIAQSGLIPFALPLVPQSLGMHGPTSAQDIGADSRGYHYWVADNGAVYRFDGVSILYLGFQSAHGVQRDSC